MASPSRVYWFHVIFTTNTDQSLSQVGLYSRRAEHRRKVGTEFYKTCWIKFVTENTKLHQYKKTLQHSKRRDKFRIQEGGQIPEILKT